MPFSSTKRFGPISTGHRQWRDDGHCAWLHGYGRTVKVEFSGSHLDEKMWMVDFGALRGLKAWLESEWDHRMLIASDDPELAILMELDAKGIISINVLDVNQGYGPGIEASCKYVYDKFDAEVRKQTEGRCWVEQVEIWEHEFNSAIYKRPQV